MSYKRVKEVRSLLKMSQKEFGDKLGVSRNVIANIEYNRVEPPRIFLQHLCNTFSVNPDWLKTGEGDILLSNNKNLSEVLQAFGSLNPHLQEYAIKQIKLLLELQEKQNSC